MGVTNEARLLSFKDPCHPRDIWNDKMKAGSIYILPFDNRKNIIKELWIKDASKRVEATYSSDGLIKEPDLWQIYRGQGDTLHKVLRNCGKGLFIPDPLEAFQMKDGWIDGCSLSLTETVVLWLSSRSPVSWSHDGCVLRSSKLNTSPCQEWSAWF